MIREAINTDTLFPFKNNNLSKVIGSLKSNDHTSLQGRLEMAILHDSDKLNIITLKDGIKNTNLLGELESLYGSKI